MFTVFTLSEENELDIVCRTFVGFWTVGWTKEAIQRHHWDSIFSLTDKQMTIPESSAVLWDHLAGVVNLTELLSGVAVDKSCSSFP